VPAARLPPAPAAAAAAHRPQDHPLATPATAVVATTASQAGAAVQLTLPVQDPPGDALARVEPPRAPAALSGALVPFRDGHDGGSGSGSGSGGNSFGVAGVAITPELAARARQELVLLKWGMLLEQQRQVRWRRTGR
jgi:hypothetical protein